MSFVVNFDICEKNKAGIETISSAKEDEFEMKVSGRKTKQTVHRSRSLMNFPTIYTHK